MKQSTFCVVLLFIGLFLLWGCISSGSFELGESTRVAAPVVTVDESLDSASPIENNLEPEKTTAIFTIPAQVDLAVPFASQAPLGDWDLPYQEACEESSVIQAAKYFSGKKLNNEIMDQEIKDLVVWEEKNLGFYTDTSVAEMARIAIEYFTLNAEVSTEVTIENIKKQLALGNLVLVPTYGRALGNPYFRGEGPIYHFIVVRGYGNGQFIVNDVGTRRGESYQYNYNILLGAIHDLPSQNGVVIRPYELKDSSDAEKTALLLSGPKRMLIISK